MLDILDIINEATKEANSFENHAAKALTLEERLLYLQGLALVMNADGEIHPEEKEYIRILIKSFEMDESILDSFVEFAQRPDKDTVQAFFRTFRRRPIAQLFLFDALMMTRRDDSVDEREKAVVDKISEQLEILKGTYQDIYDLFCHIKNKDWDESSLYFTTHLLNPEYFNHLLDYYEVDFDKLISSNSEKNKSRLIEVICREFNEANLDISWGELGNTIGDCTEVTTVPVNYNVITKSILVPWLQSLCDRKIVSIRHGVVYLDNNDELLDLVDEGLRYDPLNKSITLDVNVEPYSVVKNDKVIGFYFEKNKIALNAELLVKIFKAKNIAMCNGKQLPTLNGKQFSAVTTGSSIGTNGHPNAISEIKDNKIVIRWCNHCKSGHGSTASICDDGDRRFTDFEFFSFIKEHGVYLVR